eukprot:2711-Heterococcus_DN1.PRE.1
MPGITKCIPSAYTSSLMPVSLLKTMALCPPSTAAAAVTAAAVICCERYQCVSANYVKSTWCKAAQSAN